MQRVEYVEYVEYVECVECAECAECVECFAGAIGGGFEANSVVFRRRALDRVDDIY